MIDSNKKIKISEWTYDKVTGELSRTKHLIQLTKIQKNVLNLLLSKSPKVVEREVFVNEIWKDKIVNEEALSRIIAELRKAFGDTARESKFIKTIPKTGYQFVQDFETLEEKAKKKYQYYYFAAFFLISFIAFYFLQKDSFEEKLKNQLQLPIRLISEIGMEQQSILSADGSKLLYAKYENKKPFLVMIDRKNVSEKVVITHPKFNLRSPVYINENEIGALGNDNSKCVLLTYSLSKKIWKELDECMAHAESRMLNYNSTNDRLIYVSKDKNNQSVIKAYDRNSNDIIALVTENKGLIMSPSLDKKSRYLSYSLGNSSARNLWLVDIETMKKTQLTKGNHYTSSHSWLDDSHIVFDSDQTGSRQFWLMNINTKETSLLGLNGAQHPSFNEDSSLMTYQNVNYEANIWSLDLDSGNIVRLTSSTRYDNFPSLSPNGEQFLFTSNRQDIGSIWKYDLKTKQEIQFLSIDGAKLTRPHWHPSGEKVYITANDDSGFWTLEYSISTKTYKRLKPGIQNIDAQSNGKGIYSLSVDNQIIRHKENGFDSIIDSVSRFLLSNDDCIYFMKLDINGLWRMCDNQSQEILLDDFSPQASQYWTVDGSMLYFAKYNSSQETGIYSLDTNSKIIKLLSTETPRAVGGVLSASGKKNQVLYVKTDRVDSDIYQIELK